MRQTSLDIYRKITQQGLLPKKRMQVYEVLFNNGALTGSQIAVLFKKKHPSSEHSESIRNRITELVQQGVVAEVDTIECPITGNMVLQFQTTDSLPVKLERKETKHQKVSQALSLIESLGKRLNEPEKAELRAIWSLVKKI